MSDKAKKIITGLLEGSVEAIKDSAKQITETVAPGALLEQAIGTGQPKKDEFSEYLKKLGPELTPEELEKKKQEFSQKDLKEKQEAQKILSAATTPTHMRLPQKSPGQSVYDQNMKELEEKKALQVEMQQKQNQQVIPVMSQKAAPGGLFSKKRRPKSSDLEAGKNIKVG